MTQIIIVKKELLYHWQLLHNYGPHEKSIIAEDGGFENHEQAYVGAVRALVHLARKSGDNYSVIAYNNGYPKDKLKGLEFKDEIKEVWWWCLHLNRPEWDSSIKYTSHKHWDNYREAMNNASLVLDEASSLMEKLCKETTLNPFNK